MDDWNVSESILSRRFGLTPRESQVARMLAHRATTREMADRLSLSPYTVNHHCERVLQRLGVRSRIAVRSAILDMLKKAGEP